jgi:predicted RNA-binding protein with PUA-like domain
MVRGAARANTAANPRSLNLPSNKNVVDPRYWLMKSEPDEFSIDDLVRDGSTPWFGVRNYQARNFMRDQMKVGDGVLFYHSSCEVPGIYGIARVASKPHPDLTQFDRKSPYYDAKSKRDDPRWMLVDVDIVKKTRVMPLDEMRGYRELQDMVVLRRGNRLSITPVAPHEWRFILELLGG